MITGRVIGTSLALAGSAITAAYVTGGAFLRSMGRSIVGNVLGGASEGAAEAIVDGTIRGARVFASRAEETGEALGGAVNKLIIASSRVSREGVQELVENTAGVAAKSGVLHVLPYAALSLVATAVSSVGTALLLNYIYEKLKFRIGRPELATEVKQRTILTPLFEKIRRSEKIQRPLFNSQTTSRIDELIKATETVRKKRGFFPHVLFYGPPGTGKTMISEYIAKQSKMSYIKMSGGDLPQYIRRGEHVTEWNRLADKVNRSWRPWSTRPWILFIDEAEGFAKDRSKLTQSLLELQNAFLNRTGTPSKKFMLILSTNRLEDLDSAILSRMDYKIRIDLPEEAERIAIIPMYLPQFFTPAEISQFFTTAQIASIAKATAGCTGRFLFKMLNVISNKKMAAQDGKLTSSMIQQVVQEMVEQEKKIEGLCQKKEVMNPPKSPVLQRTP